MPFHFIGHHSMTPKTCNLLWIFSSRSDLDLSPMDFKQTWVSVFYGLNEHVKFFFKLSVKYTVCPVFNTSLYIISLCHISVFVLICFSPEPILCSQMLREGEHTDGAWAKTGMCCLKHAHVSTRSSTRYSVSCMHNSEVNISKHTQKLNV